MSTSIIEPIFPKDEELIYEGDVDNDEVEYANQVEMDMDEEEEEKDELIVDFTAGELDLDPRPSEDKKGSASKPFSNIDKAESKPADANKVDTEESSEERFVSVFVFLYRSNTLPPLLLLLRMHTIKELLSFATPSFSPSVGPTH